jgi:hypothetical protein
LFLRNWLDKWVEDFNAWEDRMRELSNRDPPCRQRCGFATKRIDT